MTAKSSGWSVFDGFTLPTEPRTISWEGVASWLSRVEAQLGGERHELALARASSDARLADLGGDPTVRDWTQFLPLRRDREEDWSDWLAQLFEDSVVGEFGYRLLQDIENRPRQNYIRPTVHREVVCGGGRADLLIEWSDWSYTHIEVKVGDPELAKTLATSVEVEKRFFPRARRADVILLLPSQLDAWTQACVGVSDMHARVRVITWLDVVRALRVALPIESGEPISWRVWAHAFCGAIEQDLLGMRAAARPDEWAGCLGFRQLHTAARIFNVEGGRSARRDG
jgi:hypothetical protein